MSVVKLGSLILDIASGPFGSNLKVEEFVPEGFPIIDGANLKGVKLTDNITKFVSEEKAYSLERSIARRHDIVVTISGTLGQLSYIPTDSKYPEYLCSQRQFRVTFDESKVDVEFLAYYFHTPWGQQKILSFANYVGVPALSQPIPNFKNIVVDLPPINEQRKIVSALRLLDTKIENNASVISQLESLAKTIYDYWFLQFEFPNEEGKPYKSSGGKMVWCEELKREIPEGWEVSKLCRVLDIFQNKIDIKSLENRKYIPIEVIPRHQMSFYETAPLSKASTGLCSFNEKTILLSNRRVYFHKVVISPYKGVTRDTVITILPTDKNNLGYVFQLIYSDHFIKYASLHSYGTEQPVLSPDAVYNYKFAYPTNGLDLQYSKNVEPLINYVLEKERENEKLSSLRDFLLPMLMNGQVTLKDN